MADMNPLPALQDDLLKDRAREFVEFLDHEESGNRDAIKRMLRLGERRLVISLDELRDYKRELADGSVAVARVAVSRPLIQSKSNRLLKTPLEYQPAFDAALKEVVTSVADPTKHIGVQDSIFYVALRGSFGDHHVNPRTLRAVMLGKMISIEGIVTRCWCNSTGCRAWADLDIDATFRQPGPTQDCSYSTLLPNDQAIPPANVHRCSCFIIR